MSIAEKTLVAVRQYYYFHLPKKKHPDMLIQDWLHSSGEFSALNDIAFENHLKWMQRDKEKHLSQTKLRQK